jgi:hypothetical protein
MLTPAAHRRQKRQPLKYSITGKNAVTNIPEYAPPSVATDFDELSQIDLPYNASVPPKTERQVMEEKYRAPTNSRNGAPSRRRSAPTSSARSPSRAPV